MDEEGGGAVVGYAPLGADIWVHAIHGANPPYGRGSPLANPNRIFRAAYARP